MDKSSTAGIIMRKVFGKQIVELAKKDQSIVVIVCDIGYGVFDDFVNQFPDRFFNFGICEQSSVSAAAGMALEGLKPYIYSITPFLIERAFEQIKLDINEQKPNVKLIGYADYPTQGPSHAEIDGAALMKMFNNIDSYFPNSTDEVKTAVNQSYSNKYPAFISLKKLKF